MQVGVAVPSMSLGVRPEDADTPVGMTAATLVDPASQDEGPRLAVRAKPLVRVPPLGLE